ncbi:hypothetical protein [Erythrobacter oryzae]|uniref:hypothetical protein n=1 Tax=Erythrobacter oryzae TaxID=3019556 RepID=UPI002556C4FE|nr:hypothetical protein [Erythrobacter sp. COR-2]
MFEKANPSLVRADAPSGGLSAEERALLRAAAKGGGAERFAPRQARRNGEALRAMEWSELTARLNAARDLRLLLRTENQAPIEAAAASFGDAAASYFALLEDSEPPVNPDALGQSKPQGAMVDAAQANRPENANGTRSDAPRGAARDMR